MFNYGMRILTSVEGQNGSYAWFRAGTEIEYYQNNFKRDSTGPSRYYYQLSFSLELDCHKTTYFAYCYPYTYQQLQLDLAALKSAYCNR